VMVSSTVMGGSGWMLGRRASALGQCLGARRRKGCPHDHQLTKRLHERAPPNGWRLSCGALKKDSFLIYARRQLQALVR